MTGGLTLCDVIIFQMSSPDSMQGLALIDVAQEFGWSRLALIAADNEYGTELCHLWVDESHTKRDTARTQMKVTGKNVLIL